MHKPDFDEFRALLNALAVTFAKPQPDDRQVQAYWLALKDQSLASVKRCADHHTRYGKYFPKPVELRPKDDKPDGGVRDDSGFKAASDDARRWAERMAREGTPLSLARLRDATLTRQLIALREDDPSFPEFKREWQRNGDELTRLHGVSR